MAIRKYKGILPELSQTCWVDRSAQVIGQCQLAEDVSVWPCAVLRGDVNDIKVGPRSNIQDGVVVHATHESARSKGSKTIIGADVTVGHNVVLHGCIIDDECLIGMGSVILDNAHIKKHVLIGANSLVPAGKTLESGFLYLGSPVKQMRPLTDDEKAFFTYSSAHYVKLKNEFMSEESSV